MLDRPMLDVHGSVDDDVATAEVDVTDDALELGDGDDGTGLDSVE